MIGRLLSAVVAFGNELKKLREGKSNPHGIVREDEWSTLGG
jgi:hypothetical protein